MQLYFITGNQSKADYLTKFLGLPVKCKNLNLEEIQSLDLKEIIAHKARQAYAKIHQPVIVDDTSLEFAALGRLPGPFIKFFLEEMPLEEICSLLKGKSRKATARCVLGYFDGKILKLFEGKLAGKISNKPAGSGGYGWDSIFIPKGYRQTRAELGSEADRKTYLQLKPFEKLKKYLSIE